MYCIHDVTYTIFQNSIFSAFSFIRTGMSFSCSRFSSGWRKGQSSHSTDQCCPGPGFKGTHWCKERKLMYLLLLLVALYTCICSIFILSSSPPPSFSSPALHPPLSCRGFMIMSALSSMVFQYLSSIQNLTTPLRTVFEEKLLEQYWKALIFFIRANYKLAVIFRFLYK